MEKACERIIFLGQMVSGKYKGQPLEVIQVIQYTFVPGCFDDINIIISFNESFKIINLI